MVADVVAPWQASTPSWVEWTADGTDRPDPRRFADGPRVRARDPQRYPQRALLLPMLHLVQSEEGYVTEGGIDHVRRDAGTHHRRGQGGGHLLHDVQGRPVGDYHVGVCTNTLCGILGGDAIWEPCPRTSASATTRSPRTAPDFPGAHRVPGGLHHAPVMMANWEFMDNMNPNRRPAAGRRSACGPRGEVHPRSGVPRLQGDRTHTVPGLPTTARRRSRPPTTSCWPDCATPRSTI
jgi:NADH:ubiquinone oxidoreductase subunit E